MRIMRRRMWRLTRRLAKNEIEIRDMGLGYPVSLIPSVLSSTYPMQYSGEHPHGQKWRLYFNGRCQGHRLCAGNGVGILGYAFMGKAHSHAMLTIPHMIYPPPAIPKL